MGSDVITVDFDGVLTEEQLYDVEQEANEAVLRNVPVTISYPSKEELETMDYRLKHINTLGIARLLSVKPEEAGDAVVRLKQKNIEMKKEIKQLKKELYALQGAPERK